MGAHPGRHSYAVVVKDPLPAPDCDWRVPLLREGCLEKRAILVCAAAWPFGPRGSQVELWVRSAKKRASDCISVSLQLTGSGLRCFSQIALAMCSISGDAALFTDKPCRDAFLFARSLPCKVRGPVLRLALCRRLRDMGRHRGNQ